MKNLLIIGARGFGREICSGISIFQNDFKIKGFLDDNRNALKDFEGYPPIISSVEEYTIQEDDVFFCALGSPFYRKKYAEIILSKGGEFISLINPYSFVHPNAKIGKGCFIGQYTTISCNTVIGDFTVIHPYSNIGHDTKIGKFCELESYTFSGGFSKIGECCTLHTRATILPHMEVEDNATVGAGSVVIKKVRTGTSVFGVPAKKIIY